MLKKIVDNRSGVLIEVGLKRYEYSICTPHQVAERTGKSVQWIRSLKNMINTDTQETSLDVCYPFPYVNKRVEKCDGPMFIIENKKYDTLIANYKS